MKNIFLALLWLLPLTGLMAQNGNMARKSPMAIAKFKEGNNYIKVVYSQPSKNDRKIFGGIVPFGKVWRTGANEATEITFTQKVKIGGKIVNPGTYALFTIPGEKTWSIILNSELGMWGEYDYDAKKDILKVEVIPSTTEAAQELFTIKFDKTATGCNMSMMWDTVMVVIPIDSKL